MWVWLWVSSFLDVGIQMAGNGKTTSKLTALGVGRAIPTSSQFKLFDGGGLHLVVTPAGGKPNGLERQSFVAVLWANSQSLSQNFASACGYNGRDFAVCPWGRQIKQQVSVNWC